MHKLIQSLLDFKLYRSLMATDSPRRVQVAPFSSQRWPLLGAKLGNPHHVNPEAQPRKVVANLKINNELILFDTLNFNYTERDNFNEEDMTTIKLIKFLMASKLFSLWLVTKYWKLNISLLNKYIYIYKLTWMFCRCEEVTSLMLSATQYVAHIFEVDEYRSQRFPPVQGIAPLVTQAYIFWILFVTLHFSSLILFTWLYTATFIQHNSFVV